MAISPDDASLALRGMQTLGIRLERLEASALAIAEWLQERPEVECLLHPALPGSPGHELWARDFSGSASVFSFVFKADYRHQQVMDLVDRLQLFRQGFSWGGTTSLVMMYPGLRRPDRDYENRLVRLNIGLEEVHDLIVDLSKALVQRPSVADQSSSTRARILSNLSAWSGSVLFAPCASSYELVSSSLSLKYS